VVTLKVTCQTKGDFSAKFLDQFPNGGFFVPTRLRAKPGEPVMLSLRIGSRAAPVMLRAFVRWIQRGKVSPKTRAGVAVEFLPSEAQGRDHLLSIAKPEGATRSARRHLRIPIGQPIHWSVRGAPEERSGLLHDISVGGAMIRTKEWIKERSEAFVTILPPGADAAMSVLGRVAWTEPGIGFGVVWRARDRGGARRIKELVRRLEQVARERQSHYAITDAQPQPPILLSPSRGAREENGSSNTPPSPVVDSASLEWQEFNAERSYLIRDYREEDSDGEELPARRATGGA